MMDVPSALPESSMQNGNNITLPAVAFSHTEHNQDSVQHFNHELPTISASTIPPRTISLLLINPNSTTGMTTACLNSLQETLPPFVTVTGFTAPHPSPSAIESATDAVLSTAASLRALAPLVAAQHFDGFLVACFSMHPLIAALREECPGQPVMGIMEAAVYGARVLGGRFGIVCTGERSKVMHEDSVRALGLSGFCAGVIATGLGVLETHDKEAQGRVLGLVEAAARELVQERGTECVMLACAGFVGAVEHVRGVVEPMGAVVVDGVSLGVQMLAGLCREGLGTAKGGVYRSSAAARKKRGQDWL